MYVFDLHVHTAKGSSDSSLTPEELVQEARRIGLHGVCVTEHSGAWASHDFQRFAAQQDIVLLQGIEVDTDMGHILVFGLDGYMPGMARVAELRRIVDEAGGVMVAAHPFRNLYNPPPFNQLLINRSQDIGALETVDDAVAHPLFRLVDAVEVANGGNTVDENTFAHEVTQHLGMPGTGGSDAHSTNGVGRCVTVFDRPVRTMRELVEALRAGACDSAYRGPSGVLDPVPGHRD